MIDREKPWFVGDNTVSRRITMFASQIESDGGGCKNDLGLHKGYRSCASTRTVMSVVEGSGSPGPSAHLT